MAEHDNNSNPMMDSWNEAQKMMWNGFLNAAKTMTEPYSREPRNPYLDMYNRAAEQWRSVAQESMNTVMGDGSSLPKDVAGQVAAGQDAMMRFMNMATEAWQTMAPTMAQGGDWEKMLSDYTENMRAQMTQMMPGTNVMSQSMPELWQAYLSSAEKLTKPWLEAMNSASANSMMGMPMMGQTEAGNNGLNQLTSSYWSAFEKTVAPYTQSPTFGYNREYDAKVRRAFGSWVSLQRANAEYQLLMADIAAKAFEQVMRDLAEKFQKGETISSYKELANQMISTSDEVFLESFRGEAYIKTQGQLLNAAMAHKINERELTEVFLEAQGMPTRTELDETHQTIYELRKELRNLRRDIRTLREDSEPSSGSKPAKKSSTRRTSKAKTRASGDEDADSSDTTTEAEKESAAS
ncbi:MAG: poly(R)-hydroxyalkanoic acid synthase subunit PhaE [Trueperaceae bacterium]|nr:poly(R)-hydroxyalkanoic acid synthase subunit PhaE [Trueperaceae bacterium]